eukprot:SAG31_NODE_19904_length_588_cov_2.498978_1_plen_68_part_10
MAALPPPQRMGGDELPELAAFERDGCAVVGGAGLTEAQVDALRADLEPWAERQIARPSFGAGRFWEGA